MTMSQELQYLRNELNQQIKFQHEQVNKIINLILITWGGVIYILGKDGVDIMVQNSTNAVLYFVGATIFFVSNIILCSCERYNCDCADAIFKIAAYIQVFHEKRPSNVVKVSENTCWETTNFELLAQDVKRKVKLGKNFYEQWLNYKLLNYISLFFLILCSVAAFWANHWEFNKLNLVLLLCVFYIGCSIYMFYSVIRYTFPKKDFDMRIKHLKKFFQYSLDTRHYTEQEIKDRFGVIYKICKQYPKTQQNKI